MEPGQSIQGRYRIEQILGQGSMGITYKALDLSTQRAVAVKQLHLSRMGEWKSLEMFEREAKILQQLDHPRIPKYIEYFSDETALDVQFLLVQEYIEGKTLQQLLEEGWARTESEILDVFFQLVEILAYLHNLRPPVIHRDLNPKNIILSSKNEVYLVDFGAVQEVIRTTFLGGSTIVGTFGYIPFEQFSGKTVPASDYYALGATLLYMLTHREPADFPAEDLHLEFQPYLDASPSTVLLLEGLLEPSVEQRIASPHQIKAILAGRKPVQVSAPSATTLQPSKTNIKKFVKEDDHIRFSIPKRQISSGIPRLLLGLYLSSNLVYWIAGLLGGFFRGISLLFVLLGLFGLFFFAKGLGCMLGRTVLDLRPRWVEVSSRLFGIPISKIHRIPIAALRSSDITWYFKKGIIPRPGGSRLILGINHAGKTLEIGTKLTRSETAWLAQEITAYLSRVKLQERT